MGLKVTAMAKGIWTVAGAQDHMIPMSVTQEMEHQRRPDAHYFEPRVSIEFPRGNDSANVEGVEYIHLGWNAFYNRTVEELREGVERAKKELEGDESFKVLNSYIQKMKREGKMVPVANVVALGIGSLHAAYYRLTDNDEEEEKRHDRYQLSVAHNQLATVIKLAELLGEEGKPLPCVIQDPAYSMVEKECLRCLGFQCVDDPDAFSCIDERSLLFSVGTYWHMLKRVSTRLWPAVLVCNGRLFTSTDDNHPSQREPSSIKDMVKDCVEEAFPYRWCASSWTNGVMLYWRRIAENK